MNSVITHPDIELELWEVNRILTQFGMRIRNIEMGLDHALHLIPHHEWGAERRIIICGRHDMHNGKDLRVPFDFTFGAMKGLPARLIANEIRESYERGYENVGKKQRQEVCCET